MWTLAALALAAPKDIPEDASALRADIAHWEAMLGAHGKYTFKWTEDELEELAKGEVVKRRERLDGADRAMAAVWTSAPLDNLWVAVQDEDHDSMVKGLVEERLPGSTFQDKILFQLIDLPWPFADRQWVIRVVNNLDLYAKSEGRCWERTWDLTPERGAKNESESAVWVDTNDGGWLAAEVAGGSLVVYHARTVIGGNVPDDAASQWAMLTLGGMMRDIASQSLETPNHYHAPHSVIRRPDGSDIPFASGQ